MNLPVSQSPPLWHELNNHHAPGQMAVIVGKGPSLDAWLAAGCPRPDCPHAIIAINNATLALEAAGIVADYGICQDRNADYALARCRWLTCLSAEHTGIKFSDWWRKPGWARWWFQHLFGMDLLNLSRDQIADTHQLFGATSTAHPAVHFAWYLGFESVQLIGIDGGTAKAESAKNAPGYYPSTPNYDTMLPHTHRALDHLFSGRWWHWQGPPPALLPHQMKHGLCWPAGDVHTPDIVMSEVRRLPRYLDHVKERGTVIQAGGNVGAYALALAASFQQVVVVEPHPENWHCLQQNLAAHPRITAHHAALGDGSVPRLGVALPQGEHGNYGATITCPGDTVPVLRVDDLASGAVDFLLLDIEGDEPLALAGAQAVLARDKPVLSLEMKGLARRHGMTDEALAALIQAMGYIEAAPIGRDRLWVFQGITFVCVLKTGGLYTAAHVDRLWQMLRRYHAAPFRFICLTDDPAVPYGRALRHGWPGWWAKLEIFEHDWGLTCYLDLDVTITAPLDWLDALPAGRFHGMQDAFLPGRMNSSVMIWTGPLPGVTAGFDIDVHRQDREGDQAWIETQIHNWMPLVPPQVCSFKKHGLDAASIVVFHGKPKPWD